jgi:hypothetical protein
MTGKAVRTGACVLSVVSHSLGERKRLAELLPAAGRPHREERPAA